jgi:hypothetical protein
LLGDSDGTPKKRGSLPETAGADVMQFKAAVDQLRRTLWFYCDEEPASAPPQRQYLVPQVPPGEQSPEPVSERHSGSFFDRLNLVIDGYIQPNGSIRRPTSNIKL